MNRLSGFDEDFVNGLSISLPTRQQLVSNDGKACSQRQVATAGRFPVMKYGFVS